MKNLTKFYLFGVLLVLSSILLSCAEDSVLSDVEIDDPSLIYPKVELFRARSKSGALTTRADCRLIDRKGDNVILKEGSVKFNGTKMGTVKEPFSDAEYYTIQKTIAPATTYTITVVLADGQGYDAVITTQEYDLHTFTVPAVHDKTQDMTVSWQDFGDDYPMKIEMSIHYENDDESGTLLRTIALTNSNMATGVCTIPASYFTEKEGTDRVDLTLISEHDDGTIDDKFRAGGSIKSQFSIARSCTIN